MQLRCVGGTLSVLRLNEGLIHGTTLASCAASHLEEAERGAHGGLDVERLHVLPVLLEKGDEEVDGGLGVDEDLLLGHLDVGDGDGEAEHLLELELHLGTDAVNLVLEGLVVRAQGGELASLVEAGAQETGDLLDHGLGREEVVVLLGELLDQLLVLVELLERLDVHVVDAYADGFFAVLGVAEHAELELRAGDVGERHGAVETLVLLGIVVLEADLELDGLGELTGLLLGLGEDVRDAVADLVGGELAVGSRDDEMGGVRSVECRQRRSVQAS